MKMRILAVSSVLTLVGALLYGPLTYAKTSSNPCTKFITHTWDGNLVAEEGGYSQNVSIVIDSVTSQTEFSGTLYASNYDYPFTATCTLGASIGKIDMTVNSGPTVNTPAMALNFSVQANNTIAELTKGTLYLGASEAQLKPETFNSR